MHPACSTTASKACSTRLAPTSLKTIINRFFDASVCGARRFDALHLTFRPLHSSTPSFYLPQAALRLDSLSGFDSLRIYAKEKRKHTLRYTSFFSFGGTGVVNDEHPSMPVFSPSKASSISSSGIWSMLNGFLLALMIIVK